MLISFAVTAKLICIFVFAYAKSRFSHDAAQINTIPAPIHSSWSPFLPPTGLCFVSSAPLAGFLENPTTKSVELRPVTLIVCGPSLVTSILHWPGNGFFTFTIKAFLISNRVLRPFLGVTRLPMEGKILLYSFPNFWTP